MKNFNELFKKKLAEQQFDEKEKYWSQLEKKLNETAQEKVVLAWYKKWLLPAIAILVMGTSALLFINKKQNNNNTVVANRTTNNTAPLQSAQDVNASVQNNTNEISADNTELSSDAVANNGETKKINAHENSNSVSTSTDISNNRNTTQFANKSGTNAKTNSVLHAENNVAVKNNVPQTNSYTTKGKEPVLSNPEFEENSSTVASNSLQTPVLNSNETSQNQTEEYSSPAPSHITPQLDFRKAAMPLAFMSPKALSELIYPETKLNLTTDLVPVKPVKAKSSISLSVYGGAMFSMKNLLNNDGVSSDYINRRKSQEVNTIKPHAGIDVELKRGHWTLTSGVNFHQQGEKRNYSDEFKRIVPYDSLVININDNSAWLVDSTTFYALFYNSVTTSYDTTITYYDEASGLYYTAQLPVNLNQNTTVDTNYYYLIDSTYYSDIDTLKTNYELKKQLVIKDPNQANLKGRNTFSYVEIPLLVGYEWGIRRWRLSVKAGMGVGILTRQKSFYLTTDEAEVAPVSTDVYTKIMYNGILRAGLHYNFTPAFGIDIVPFSRLNINNMTHKNATFQQKYGNAGLQIGFSYKL